MTVLGRCLDALVAAGGTASESLRPGDRRRPVRDLGSALRGGLAAGAASLDLLTAYDEADGGFAVVAHVATPRTPAGARPGAHRSREDPVGGTATGVHAGAAWHERETHEMGSGIGRANDDPALLLLGRVCWSPGCARIPVPGAQVGLSVTGRERPRLTRPAGALPRLPWACRLDWSRGRAQCPRKRRPLAASSDATIEAGGVAGCRLRRPSRTTESLT